MEVKNKRREFRHEAVILVLAAFLGCSPVYSATDFSYLEIGAPKTIKLINPLYLDTSRTIKPVIKTITPYNGELNESEYFSSTTENDVPAVQEVQPPEQNDFFAPPAEEAVYTAGVDEVDLEGKIINEISFEGLKTISPEAIKSQIKTIAGSLFNEELLQQDLQRIYAVGFFY